MPELQNVSLKRDEDSIQRTPIIQREESGPSSAAIPEIDKMLAAITAGSGRIKSKTQQDKSSTDNVVSAIDEKFGGATEVAGQLSEVKSGFGDGKEALSEVEDQTTAKAEQVTDKKQLKQMESKLDEGLAKPVPSGTEDPGEVEVKPKRSLGSRIKGWFAEKILGIKRRVRKLNAKLMAGVMKFFGKFNDVDASGFSDDVSGMVADAKTQQAEEAENVGMADEFSSKASELSDVINDAK